MTQVCLHVYALVGFFGGWGGVGLVVLRFVLAGPAPLPPNLSHLPKGFAMHCIWIERRAASLMKEGEKNKASECRQIFTYVIDRSIDREREREIDVQSPM